MVILKIISVQFLPLQKEVAVLHGVKVKVSSVIKLKIMLEQLVKLITD